MLQRLELFVRSLVGSLTRKINGRHVSGLIVDTSNGFFAIDSEDFAVGRQLRMNGEYGTEEIERLGSRITPGSRVLVVGAHIGTLAIPLARKCREVVAIEANPATYKLLTQNIALNAISNCQAINIAASDKEESIKFLLNKVNSGGSKRTPINKTHAYYYDRPEEITVPAFSLDQYLDDKAFDVVIMDIEGSEYFALRGMREILSGTKLLAVEFLPHHLRNVSGVTVAQFLSVVAPYFSKLTVPSRGETVGAAGFLPLLADMFDKDQGDDGILFEKA
ncbi:FkbM family methyltransferase [Caenimonas terrae]|uniref:FkbM family methyltransferase n=1 Tax=Caenimonas terrae TaxID=696074 RepID=A0ABW0NCG8_9BURK